MSKKKRSSPKKVKRKKKKRDDLIPDDEIVCPRCGNYGATYWHGRNELCKPCIERVILPLENEGIGAGDILRGVMALGSKVGPKAAVIMLLAYAPLIAVNALGLDPGGMLGMLWTAFAGLIAAGAVVELGLQHADGNEQKAGAAFGLAGRRFFALFLAELAAELVVMVFALMLVVPGILRALSYALILPLVMTGEAYGVDALGKSRKMMSGHRRAAFGAYLLAAVPSFVVFGAYASVVGIDVAMGLGATVTEAPVGDPILDALYSTLSPLVQIPLTLVSTVLFVKLRPKGKRVVWEAEAT